jgi:N-acylneuraminate cytidylyltransferase
MMLAVIPARGGSKRLPRKNVLPLGGRPLLAWSVALARRIPSVVRCVVSTDDPEIAAAARAAGADVVERPPELSTDEALSIDATIHAAEQMQRAGVDFNAIMLLQPTNPFRPVEMVERALRRFATEPCDSLVAVSRRQLKLGRIVDGCFAPDQPYGTPSRILAPSFFENGLLYLTQKDVVMRRRSFAGDRVLAFETERPFDDVDIDEPDDLIVAEGVLAAVRHRLDY